jgi:hypothetical protein
MKDPDVSLTLRSRTYTHPPELDAFLPEVPIDGQRVIERVVWPRYTAAQPDRNDAIVVAEYRPNRADVAFTGATGYTIVAGPFDDSTLRRVADAYFEERLKGRYEREAVRWYTYGYYGETGGYDAFYAYDWTCAENSKRLVGGGTGLPHIFEDSARRAKVVIPEIVALAPLRANDPDLMTLELSR